jgi:hypothetical protein
VCAGDSMAHAGIGYDAITGQTIPTGLVIGADEVAEDTTLDPSNGLTVTGVTMRMWNHSATGMVNATVRYSVYETMTASDGRAIPGALITTGTTHLSMPTLSITDVFIDLPDATASSPSIWTTYAFTPLEQPGIYPEVGISGLPTIGSTAPIYRYFTGGSWQGNGASNGSLAIQVQTIPGPGGLSVLGGVAILSARWRRGAK